VQSSIVTEATARRPNYWFAAFILMAVVVVSLVAVATTVA
jgi:hypothetical protein